jgi:hypothetical protein
MATVDADAAALRAKGGTGALHPSQYRESLVQAFSQLPQGEQLLAIQGLLREGRTPLAKDCLAALDQQQPAPPSAPPCEAVMPSSDPCVPMPCEPSTGLPRLFGMIVFGSY